MFCLALLVHAFALLSVESSRRCDFAIMGQLLHGGSLDFDIGVVSGTVGSPLGGGLTLAAAAFAVAATAARDHRDEENQGNSACDYQVESVLRLQNVFEHVHQVETTAFSHSDHEILSGSVILYILGIDSYLF